jgi:hypothetical protein
VRFDHKYFGGGESDMISHSLGAASSAPTNRNYAIAEVNLKARLTNFRRAFSFLRSKGLRRRTDLFDFYQGMKYHESFFI